MKLDRMKRYGADEVVDVVVVGTGAGAAPLLARLAAAGVSAVALEAGDNFEPDDHTPDEIAAGEIYWLDERLSAGADPEAFGANNSGKGVGGSMIHWGAFTPRPDARDLRLRSECGVGEDWPIDHADLIEAIQQVEADIGVSGPALYPWDPGRSYRYPPVALNAPAEAMRRGCEALGIVSAAAPAAVLTRDVTAPGCPPRQACVGCGACHQGCRNGAKASMDVTYLPLAVGAGVEIRPRCVVHGVERDATGRIVAVVYRHGGRDHRQRCSALVLSAGAIETPRLMLHAGFGNASGQVGRNYMAHLATQVWGTFDDEMRCNRGYPSSLITEDMVRPKDAGFAAGYLIQSLGVLPVTWAENVARGRGLWGDRLVDYIDRYNFVAGIGINGECLPQDGNRLTLADETDSLGIPKARISFDLGPNERAMISHATETMEAIWRAAGASDIWSFDRIAHTIGTCRMGTDPERAVVDPRGRSFEIPNLWICDNSVFPSSLAANPALTIMALSLRTADAMLEA